MEHTKSELGAQRPGVIGRQFVVDMVTGKIVEGGYQVQINGVVKYNRKHDKHSKTIYSTRLYQYNTPLSHKIYSRPKQPTPWNITSFYK